jgi:hypothetical protein
MDMKKKKLRVIAPGFAGYNGPLGVYEFTDGVSNEEISPADRDRISASISCVEIDEDGTETVAGVAERLVSESKQRAPVPEKLRRATDEDKILEEASGIEKAFGNIKKTLTADEIDAAIQKDGISGLRAIAEQWGLKSRSIPSLRQMILDKQEVYLAKMKGKASKKDDAIKSMIADIAKPEAAEVVTSVADEPDETHEAENDTSATQRAAVTGDMSGAISTEKAEG